MQQQNNAQNMQDTTNVAQNQPAQEQNSQNVNSQTANPQVANAHQNVNNNPYIQQNVNPYYKDASQNPHTYNQNSFFNSLTGSEFLKGALIGAAAGFLLTNEKAQKTIFKTVAKGTQMLQMGVEEMKERFEDAKAEMETK